MSVLSNTMHEKFAQLLSTGMSQTKAYVSVYPGCSTHSAKSLASRLYARKAIRERVLEIKQIIADGALNLEIADRNNRLRALNRRWQKMHEVIDERGQDPKVRSAPGGKTGLLVREVKAVGQGENAEIVEEFKLDAALLKEVRAHEQQAAQELGQWEEKLSVTGAVSIEDRLKSARERLSARSKAKR